MRRCSRASTSRLSQLDLKLGSHNTLQGSGGQGGLTSSRPDPTEVAIELVQLRLVGVQHLDVDWGFDPTSHFLSDSIVFYSSFSCFDDSRIFSFFTCRRFFIASEL